MVFQKLLAASEISLDRRGSKGEFVSVNLTKNLLLVGTAVLCANPILAQTGSFDFTMSSSGNYRQNPSSVDFEGGSFSMSARDGSYSTDGCSAPFFYNPSDPCPLGATGYVSTGLAFRYYSVTSVVASQLLAPFAPNSAVLVAAPPSLLPRPAGGFVDRSYSVFYNLRTTQIKQYPVASYSVSRLYTAADRKLFDGEVVPGTYQYNFARLPNPLQPLAVVPPLVVSVNNFPKLDGYRKINSQPQGVRFTNVTYDTDGFALLNPFELNTITWQGNASNLIAPSVDSLFFSIKSLTDPADPLSPADSSGATLFPAFDISGASRVILPSALETSFILAPNFVVPGQTGLIDLEFSIFRPTTSVISERASRSFRLPVRVLNPMASFLRAALPANATTQQQSADADFDGDGFSNFTEWAFGSNPALASSVPSSPGVSVVSTTPPAGTFAARTLDVGSQSAMEYKVAKLKNTLPKLKYTIEYSSNMKDWTTITTSNPAWTLTETLDEIKVTGAGSNPAPGGFFRAKVVPLP